MNEFLLLQDFEQEVPEFMRNELDFIAKLIVRNEHNELTKEEKIILLDKQNRYVAYTQYIKKQVSHLKKHDIKQEPTI